jgi:hypothetical protein
MVRKSIKAERRRIEMRCEATLDRFIVIGTPIPPVKKCCFCYESPKTILFLGWRKYDNSGGVRSCASKSNARDGTERERHILKGNDELVNSLIEYSSTW